MSKKRMNVGIWGLGRAGIGMHAKELEAYPAKFKIVAGMDIQPERVKILQERYGATPYTDAKAFLKDQDVELVSIATLSPDHVEHALMALRHGKYVFLEKPIALNLQEARRLMRADKRYPGKLFLRHNRRFEPGFTHIREIIASGKLGEVFEVKLRRNNYQRRADWQTLRSCGGGQLNNWGPHIIDHALQFLDSPVQDVWSDLKRIAAVGDAEDHLRILLRGRNGRIVDLQISGGAALTEPEAIVLGTKGALSCENNKIRLRYIDPKQKLARIKASAEAPPLEGGFGNPEKLKWIEKTIPVAPAAKCTTGSIWPALFDCIRKGVPYPISLQQGIEVVRITDIARRNSRFKI